MAGKFLIFALSPDFSLASFHRGEKAGKFGFEFGVHGADNKRSSIFNLPETKVGAVPRMRPKITVFRSGFIEGIK